MVSSDALELKLKVNIFFGLNFCNNEIKEPLHSSDFSINSLFNMEVANYYDKSQVGVTLQSFSCQQIALNYAAMAFVWSQKIHKIQIFSCNLLLENTSPTVYRCISKHPMVHKQLSPVKSSHFLSTIELINKVFKHLET